MSRERSGLRRPLLAALSILLVALSFRIIYQVQMRSSPLWDHPILDEAYNDAWARSIAEGGAPPTLPFFRAPLYPAAMGLAYRLVGPRHDLVRLGQAMLSSLACVLVWALARRTYGESAGWMAGLAAAFYWPWVYFDGELQDVPLTLFLDLAALATLVLARRPGATHAAVAGLLLGLSAITRPTVLITVPFIVLWLARAPRPGPAWRPVAVLLAGLALPILPVTVLNLAAGDRVLIASQGGMNFYLGNNAESDGHSARLAGAPAEWEAMVAEAHRRAEAAAGRELAPSAVSRHWFAEAGRFWLRRPAAALGLTARKIVYLLSAPELANNKQIEFFATRYAPIMRLPWPGFGLVAPLALVGAVWGSGGRRAALLWGFAACYGAAVVAFFVAARFRMPFAAALLVPAGGGAALLAARARGGLRRLGPPLVALALAALAINLPRAWHRENLAHAHYTLGNARRAAGEDRRAEAAYRQALAEDPGYREARRNLSALLLEAGRPRDARALLVPALRSDPDDAESRVNLGLALDAMGRPEEALAELERALAREPALLAGWLHLGNLRMEAADTAGAQEAFQRAAALAPERPEPRYNLGNLHLAAGRPARAAEEYRTVVEDHPDHRGAWNNLGIALARGGRAAEAEKAFRRGLELQPGDAQARLNLAGVLAAQGRREEARAELARALELAPPGSALRRLARQRLEALAAGP